MSEIVADTELNTVLSNPPVEPETKEPETKEVEKKEESTDADPYCVDETCKCRQKEEKSDDSEEEPCSECEQDQEQLEEEALESEEDSEDKVECDVVHIHHEHEYVPSSLIFLAYLVLFLHLINAILKMSDPPAIQCFPRPY